MKKILTYFAVLASSLFISGQALAAQKVMKIATWYPPNSELSVVIFGDMKKDLERLTDGRVTLKLEYGMGAPKDLFDMVEDGVVDATVNYHGYMPGRFDLTMFAELPLPKRYSSGDMSAAAFKVYNKYFMDAGEYGDKLYLAAFWVSPQLQMYMKKPINQLSDLKGKKIRIGGGIMKDIGEAIDIVGVSVPFNKVYEYMSQGITDGVALQYMAAKSFRLPEVAPYVYELNMYQGISSIVIGEKFLSTLSKQDRASVESLMGEKLSQKIGDVYDAYESKIKDYVKANSKVTVSESMNKEFRNKTKDIASKWLKKTSKRHPDVEKALNEYRKLLASK